MSNRKPILSVRNLSVHYGPITAVRNVSFDIAEGDVVAMVGPNGAGKSSTLKGLVGLATAHGSIVFSGNDVAGLSADKAASLGISLVPEGRRLFPQLTVLENLLAGGLFLPRTVRQAGVDRSFELFPQLAVRREQLAGTLSGGEQQMLAIGRGLMARPRLLLLDEPSLGLAPKIVDAIFELIGRLNDEGVTILLVEQNAERAIALSHRTLVMTHGTITTDDASETLMMKGLSTEVLLGIRQ